MPEYTKREIAEKIGEPVRKLHWWVREELVVPDVAPSRGKGSPLIFSERNLIEFIMFKIMLEECQLSLSAIKAVLDELRKAHAGDRSRFEFANDFYTDSMWGTDLELIYVYQHQHPETHMIFEAIKTESGTFTIIQPKPIKKPIDNEGHFELIDPPSFEEALGRNLSVTLIRLGEIKNLALKRLVIKQHNRKQLESD
jgi:DNA-binding transcriptional MerR regulator